MKHLLLLLASATSLVFTSCEKNASAPQVKEALLTKTWKRGIQDKNPPANPANASFYPVQSCEQDDTFTFAADGMVLINQGATKCSQNEPQTITQAYSINRATKELRINGQKFKLLEETEQQIKYSAELPPTTGFSSLIFLLQ
ncbi:hypothetical protein BEN47_06315 [Hymenobacter lapidarius]|uniref:Lipocalin-like domain-containing protein n=1 Tax=Hymenobacter lapidarius TaxID=1908237 RepID=A0A1G1SQH2_9BACT|nr:hypothetical protein [Hymenobacter lapidarius]OGX80864.1 hypothetical protein BEN47_06315 [Hymenobacter lapidarius]